MSRSNNRKLKVGVIGCGRIAQFVHLPVLAAMDDVELVALAEGDAERLSQAARLAPAAHTFADYRELLAASDAEAVAICLPTGLHARAAIDAFAAGRHVYLEKPIATTATDAEAVVQAWRASGRAGMIGFNYRFHPLHVELKRRLSEGQVGNVTAIRTTFCTASRDLPAWKRDRSSGGGVLLDLLSHHADLVRFLTGREICEVRATTRSVRSDADTASVEMRLSDGVIVQSTVSMAAVEEDKIEIFGGDGKLTLDRHARALDYAAPRRADDLLARCFGVMDAARSAAAESWRALRPRVEPSYAPALRHFVDAVLAGTPPSPDCEDGRRSLAVVLAAEQAAASGRAVAVAGAPPIQEHAVVDEQAIDLSGVVPQIDDAARPAMSVILVTVDRFASLRKVVNCLRQQTVRHRLELILIAPTEAALADRASADTEGFFGVRTIAAGPIENVDKVAARGVRVAAAPVVALLEDHAYPEPRWAEFILEAHRSGPWAAVGTAIGNANPDTVLSWSNMLLSYGQWTGPVHRGATRNVSRHNVTFKTAALLTYGDTLEDKLGRDGGLLGDMLGRGYQFFLEPRARVHHVNPSRWSSTIELRVGSGRLVGATRAARERWSPLKRAAYALASPAIPFLRFARLRRELFVPDRRKLVGRKANVALAVGVILDGIGQMLGFAFGPGAAPRTLAFFEMNRARHLASRDLRVMTE